MVPLVVAVCSGAVSVLFAVWFQSVYAAEPAFRAMLDGLIRAEDVAGVEVLVLALAFVVGQYVQLVFLMALSVRTFNISYLSLARLFMVSLVAAVAGAISAYVTLNFVVNGINQETFIGITLQGATAAIMGLLAVVLVYAASKSPELEEIKRALHSKILKTDVIAPQ